jgi:hypothetical protein
VKGPLTDELDYRHLVNEIGSMLHEVHSSATINKMLSERFVVRETQTVPYFYRYLIPVLAHTSEAVSFVEEVFQQEMILGQREKSFSSVAA